MRKAAVMLYLVLTGVLCSAYGKSRRISTRNDELARTHTQQCVLFAQARPSGTWRCVGLVRTDVSEQCLASNN
jgi:hypothetical protein